MSEEIERVPLAGLRVFVSYPRGGMAHSWAERLHAELRARGATVWRDEASVPPGSDSWLSSLEEGLLRADAVVCVIGRESGGCRWQHREMLRADRLALPVLVCSVASAEMPLYAMERQAIELHEPMDWQPAVDVLLQHHRRRRIPNASVQRPDPARRARELEYLDALVSGKYSDHEARYVPIGGKETTAPTLERSHKGLGKSLRIDLTLILERLEDRDADISDVPTRHADVLDVYRTLATRKIRRLVVLGEPGAGKSFSLQRIAVHHARLALQDETAPLPIFVELGLWTRQGESLRAQIERQLQSDLGPDFGALRAERRALLLLDGLNEIPSGQRREKAAEILSLAEDERFGSVVVSCRERDFQEEFKLPFDRLVLQPLTPPQVLRFLRRTYCLDLGVEEGEKEADRHFWALAGGDEVRRAWLSKKDTTWESFWRAEEDWPKDDRRWWTSEPVDAWRGVPSRSLLRLASNPYLLTVMRALSGKPRNRAELFDLFLTVLHTRERKVRDARHEVAAVPSEADWQAALMELAEALQRARSPDDRVDGAGTSLPRDRWPASMTPSMLAFSVDASALRRSGDDLRFTHQLLQEAVAARVLRKACETGDRSGTDFWPAGAWWSRSGWEVVAELAAESCVNDPVAMFRLLAWLCEAQPEVAVQAWRRVGSPPLPKEVADAIGRRWLARLASETVDANPVARACIGRAMAALDLDSRPGVGVRRDGLPDIAWVQIAEDLSISVEGVKRGALPPFSIARYPVTNRQFKSFVDSGGYADARWWQGLTKPQRRPKSPAWNESNAPRETVNWFEAMAFCNWVSHELGFLVTLPTERQWERAAAGIERRRYPWGNGFDPRWVNSGHAPQVDRTTTVGMYPHPSHEGVHDLSGNVWEWCVDAPFSAAPDQEDLSSSRVIRGGAWNSGPWSLRSTSRDARAPDFCGRDVGFRVCCVSSG